MRPKRVVLFDYASDGEHMLIQSPVIPGLNIGGRASDFYKLLEDLPRAAKMIMELNNQPLSTLTNTTKRKVA